MATRRKRRQRRTSLIRMILFMLAVLMVLLAALVYGNQRPPVEPLPIDTTPSVPAANPYMDITFTPNEMGYLTSDTVDCIPGIDVSSHQGTIDWASVKASGISFAFIRLGYRGYDTGTLHRDEQATQNLLGAKAAGLQIGAYFFSQAITAEEAQEEARYALDILDGLELDLPLAYDWEYVAESARTGAVTTDVLLECVHAFCAEANRAGYEPMVYFNPDLANTRLDLAQVSCYDFWLAFYSDEMTFPYQVRFWQYSDRGTVPGIEGNVDLDVYFPSPTSFRR